MLYDALTRDQLITRIQARNNQIPGIDTMPDYQIIAIYIEIFNINID